MREPYFHFFMDLVRQSPRECFAVNIRLFNPSATKLLCQPALCSPAVLTFHTIFTASIQVFRQGVNKA